MCFYPPLTGALSHIFLIFHRFSYCWGILDLTSCRRHSKWEMFVNYHVDFHYQTCREHDNFIENSTISRCWKIKKENEREFPSVQWQHHICVGFHRHRTGNAINHYHIITLLSPMLTQYRKKNHTHQTSSNPNVWEIKNTTLKMMNGNEKFMMCNMEDCPERSENDGTFWPSTNPHLVERL